MNTPIINFIQSYAEKNPLRLHMPGHKGSGFLGCESLDITEIQGADDLYHADGIILESEKNASSLFNSFHTHYATGGSTQCIGAMLYLALLQKKTPSKTILAGRNAHKSFLQAVAFLDLDVHWLYGSSASSHLCSCDITPQELQDTLQTLQDNQEECPFALYITSPDYLGNQLPIKELSAICSAYDIPVLVDHAHGSYLKFLNPSCHALDLGASMCCDSAHKTLPVLTGGAYLHIHQNAPFYHTFAKKALSLFGSTSPSYLILQSLDYCNQILATDYKKDLQACLQEIKLLKAFLSQNNITFFHKEPLKLCLDCKKMKISGKYLGQLLHQQNIEAEFIDPEYIVFMFTPAITTDQFTTLKATLKEIFSKREFLPPLHHKTIPIPYGNQVMSLKDAFLSPCERIPFTDAINRICHTPTISCPPAIPIVISGELISQEHIALFQFFEIDFVDVVKGAYCEKWSTSEIEPM